MLFLYISMFSLHDQGVKMPNFTFCRIRKQATTKFSFFFWTWIWFLKSLTPDDLAYNWHSKWFCRIAMKIKRARIHFLSEICAAMAIQGSWRYGKTGNKTRATCLATLLQNELNSDVARFTTHVQTCSQPDFLQHKFDLGGITRIIAIQLVLQQFC